MSAKAVAVFRFSPGEGAGYCAQYLQRHGIAMRLFQLDRGDRVPDAPDGFAGMVFMGGPMSVNDELPWIPPLLVLIRQAIDLNLPCLGHCLGGQLISKALGGTITRNPVKEIGWNPMRAESHALAREWLGDEIVDRRDLLAFQWHGETFTIPSGATRILTGDVCENQAYVLGNTLGMQCHVEMTAQMIQTWCRDWAAERADPTLPSVQTPEEILAEMQNNLCSLNQLADRLYGHWVAGLRAAGNDGG